MPRKNLKPLAGGPLISYAIRAAKESKLIDRLIVSTDDEEIAKVARGEGADVPFIRPPELAGDEISLIPVAQHSAKYLEEKEGWRADVVVTIQPTSPFIGASDIDSAVRRLIDSGCDSVVTVTEITHGHPFQALKLEGDRISPLNPEGFRFLQKQDLPKVYRINGALYARKRKVLDEWNGRDYCLGKDCRAVVMDELKSIDIDTPMDFLIADTMAREKKISG